MNNKQFIESYVDPNNELLKAFYGSFKYTAIDPSDLSPLKPKAEVIKEEKPEEKPKEFKHLFMSK